MYSPEAPLIDLKKETQRRSSLTFIDLGVGVTEARPA